MAINPSAHPYGQNKDLPLDDMACIIKDITRIADFSIILA